MRLRNPSYKMDYNLDRLESSYGNVMIRGWVVDTAEGGPVKISVQDENGNTLSVYTERLVRRDVNLVYSADGLPMGEDYEAGFHILVDRAVLNTPSIYVVFENREHRKRVKVRVNRSGISRYLRLHRPGGDTRKKIMDDSGTPDYDLWVRLQEPTRAQRKYWNGDEFSRRPKFSFVIPLYNTPLPYLQKVIDSVMKQTYPYVELCLADGSPGDEIGSYISSHWSQETRIRYRKLEKNLNISGNTNEAMALATGDFIVFADHDDIVTVDAAYELAAAVNGDRTIDVIYTDEDKVNQSGTAYFGPHFKPDFNWELLRSNNYICHLFAVRRDLAEKVGPLDSAFDGAQDYDYILRCCEQANCIHHIPRVLYHWRTHPDSTAGNPQSKAYAFEAGKRALEAHYRRMGLDAEVEHTAMRGRYRTRFALKEKPLVSILIPNMDHVEDLRRCLNSIRDMTSYQNYEIVIVENNSKQEETFAYYEELQKGSLPVRILRWEGAFQYAAIHNFAVPQVQGEYVVLLNNDTEIITRSWIEELLQLCQSPEIGVVGAKLYYGDRTIQHAGIIVGLGGPAGHIYAGCPGDREGYMGRLVSVQEVSAVTGACMMTKKSVYQAVGGMEEGFAVAYNDVDYCLRVKESGLRVVFTPYAELYHYESKSRGRDNTEEKRRRLTKETELFCRRWKELITRGDPFYSPYLSVTDADCSLRVYSSCLYGSK